MATLKERVAVLFETTAHKKIFANPKGEFFTSENIGKMSLKPGEKLTHFDRDDFKKPAKNAVPKVPVTGAVNEPKKQ